MQYRVLVKSVVADPANPGKFIVTLRHVFDPAIPAAQQFSTQPQVGSYPLICDSAEAATFVPGDEYIATMAKVTT